MARDTTAVPATPMLPAVVQVKAPSGITTKQPPSWKPTGAVKPVTAAVPVTWNSGPEGRIAPAALATAAVGAIGAVVLPNPGTQLEVRVEQSHCEPVLVLTHGVTNVLAVVHPPEG